MTAELSFDIYVEAPDYASAVKLARGAVHDEQSNYTSQDWDIHGTSGVRLDSVPGEWRNAAPYGGDDCCMTTVADYLRAEAVSR